MRVCWPIMVLLVAGIAPPVLAQLPDDLVPAAGANCRVRTPPVSAGIAPTPGGFVMVFPRNDELDRAYTGCKTLWVVDTDRLLRLATLYFENGALRRALAHDVRDPSGAVEAACALPEGRSLLPQAGRKMDDAGCRNVRSEELYALRVPTWPRSCLSNPEAAPCKQDPR